MEIVISIQKEKQNYILRTILFTALKVKDVTEINELMKEFNNDTKYKINTQRTSVFLNTTTIKLENNNNQCYIHERYNKYKLGRGIFKTK